MKRSKIFILINQLCLCSTENAVLSFIFRLFIHLKACEAIFMKRKPLFAKQEVEEFNLGKCQNMNCKGFQNRTERNIEII